MAWEPASGLGPDTEHSTFTQSLASSSALHSYSSGGPRYTPDIIGKHRPQRGGVNCKEQRLRVEKMANIRHMDLKEGSCRDVMSCG